MKNMEDITDIVDDYRECSRHIWNTYFRYLEEGDMKFSAVNEALFYAMVLAQFNKTQVGLAPTMINKEPLFYLRITPISPHGTPIMINRTGDSGCGYWDDPVNRVKPDEVDLRFLEFFDFAESQDFRDWRYYLVRIKGFPTQLHLEGRDALIDASDVRVFMTDE